MPVDDSVNPPSGISGSTSLKGKVLRIGRQRENGKPHVRLLIDDSALEFPIADTAETALFDIGKSHGWAAVDVQALWERDTCGRLRLLPSRSYIVRAREWNPASAMEFHCSAREMAPSLATVRFNEDEEDAG